MSSKGAKPVYGGGIYGFGDQLHDADVQESFDVLLAGGCGTIDTARIYGNSEDRIGQNGGGRLLAIDSKSPGGLVQGGATSGNILAHAEESLQKLDIKQLDVLYLHAPEEGMSMRDVCFGFNTAYQKGYFRRFGVSNFSPKQVQEAYDICKKEGWVLPSVYQGNYNAVARLQETEIIPVLRKLNMAFYAYSPMAGGFLTKSAEQISSAAEDAGRFSGDTPISRLYGALYNRPSMLRALKTWEETAKAEGVSKAELAYRWVIFNSALDPEKGDAVVFGANSLKQTKETLEFFRKGPVSAEALAAINKIWDSVKAEAVLNNITDDGKAAKAQSFE